MQIHERLRDLREDRDMNQTELAAILGMKQQQYSEYERGFREMPMRVYIRLARFYDVSLDYIAGLTNERKKFW